MTVEWEASEDWTEVLDDVYGGGEWFKYWSEEECQTVVCLGEDDWTQELLGKEEQFNDEDFEEDPLKIADQNIEVGEDGIIGKEEQLNDDELGEDPLDFWVMWKEDSRGWW